MDLSPQTVVRAASDPSTSQRRAPHFTELLGPRMLQGGEELGLQRAPGGATLASILAMSGADSDTDLDEPGEQ